jgi:hypothetical protein
MSDLVTALNRRLGGKEHVEVEFELRYLEHDPPASAFAYDMLYFDREVRRTAREILEGAPREGLEQRYRRRPLPIKEGLVVGESHRSDFSFLLQVPPEIYQLILSEPTEFAVRLIELSAAYSIARQIFVRVRGGDSEQKQQVLEDTAAEETSKAERGPDKGAAGGTTERIQRLRFPDGLEYEYVERVLRD